MLQWTDSVIKENWFHWDQSCFLSCSVHHIRTETFCFSLFMYSCTVSMLSSLAICGTFLLISLVILTWTASRIMKMDNPWCKSFFLFHGIRDTVRISCHVYDHLYIVYYICWIQLFLYDILFCTQFVLKIKVYILWFPGVWVINNTRVCVCVCGGGGNQCQRGFFCFRSYVCFVSC